MIFLSKALEKGFVSIVKGQNGVKTIRGRIFELKTDNDLRNKNKLQFINYD